MKMKVEVQNKMKMLKASFLITCDEVDAAATIIT